MGPTIRSTSILLALALVGTLLSGLAGSASAAGAPVVQGDRTVAPGIDHAADTFSDPWDHRNELDVLLDVNGPTQNLTNQRLQDGKLVFDVRPGGGSYWPLYMNVPGSLSDVRDGPSYPIDADRYTHVTIHAYSDRSFPGAMLRFFTCESYDQSCQGGYVFGLQPGWRTYTFRMESNNPFGLNRPWTGRIVGMRLDTGGSTDGDGAHVEIDWFRVHDDRATTTVTWTNSGSEQLYWDRDTDASNNTATNSGWGLVDATGKKGTVDSTFVHGRYEQGAYRFFVGTSPRAATSAHSEPLTIDAAPLISFDDPDETGGEDYATVALGNPWDFSDPADAAQIVNATDISWSGGQLHATNTNNDPYVRLPLAGTIDPDRYHRLTVKMTYDGQFNLADEPGGGTHGRIIWWRQDTGQTFQDSREILTFATRDTYTFDLSRPDVSEPGDRPWTGSPVTYLRWDPNEDPGAARWHLDHIKLAADDEARETFDVRWRDGNGNDGATVSLFSDGDRRGFNGQQAGTGITQRSGENTHRLRVGHLLPGRRWLYAVADNGTSVGRQYARGPLRIDPRLAGADRTRTAIALSRNAFPRGADSAIVAFDRDFPDALAAAPLAAAAGAPVLLNPRDHLDPRVASELSRLGAQTIYLMGGTSVQTPQVAADIEREVGVRPTRVAGSDRWATAASAAREARRIWQKQGVEDAGDHVLVALGTGFADALAAGPLAAAAGRPLLLVSGDTVPAPTNDVLRDFGTTDVTFIGGTTAIPPRVAEDVGGSDVRRHRIGGIDRWQTARLVADAAAAAGADPSVVIVANGFGFPDALAAGPTVAARDGVLLLSAGDHAPDETRTYLADRAGSLRWLRVAGGPAVVNEHAVGQLMDAARLPR